MALTLNRLLPVPPRFLIPPVVEAFENIWRWRHQFHADRKIRSQGTHTGSNVHLLLTVEQLTA